MSGAPITVAIVDDEPLARAKLRRLLEPVADVRVVAEAADADQAVAAVRASRPDLLFLDIDLDGRSGFEVLSAIADDPPLIVFATAFDAFAVRAFEARALDYLLKPFDAERLAETLARVRERLNERRDAGADVRAVLAELRARQDALEAQVARRDAAGERILVRGDREMTLLPLREIRWMRAADNYVELHAVGAMHLVRDTLAALEERARPFGFVRIHRSVLVNLEFLTALRPTATGDLEAVLRDGATLPVSRSYRAALTARWEGGSP